MCADYGTYIELNAKKDHLTIEQIESILSNTDAKFVIGSDAHSANRVGEISRVKKLLEKIKIPEDRIANINGKIPDFRFAKFKGVNK